MENKLSNPRVFKCDTAQTTFQFLFYTSKRDTNRKQYTDTLLRAASGPLLLPINYHYSLCSAKLNGNFCIAQFSPEDQTDKNPWHREGLQLAYQQPGRHICVLVGLSLSVTCAAVLSVPDPLLLCLLIITGTLRPCFSFAITGHLK